jgi:hypothetical protein
VIVVNNTHEVAPFADALFAMDRAWWATYGDRIKPGPELWTTNAEAAKVYRLHHIHGERGGGTATARNSIRMGGNSGFQALALALHFGAARVVLLGYDMAYGKGEQSHWHGEHRGLGNPIRARFPEWIGHFDNLRAKLPAGVEILNATRTTALHTFPRVDLAHCLA